MLPVLRRDTELQTHDPFAELERMSRDLLSFAANWRTPALDGGVGLALADLEEDDDGFTVDVDLPGVAKDAVSIELEGRRLVISAERKERERVGVLRRRTRHIGSLRHEVVLPADVDADKVEAELIDGVLTVRLPKAESSRPRRIAIS